jgi:glycosyltransferase involved in cell wall biosynthesis
MRIVEVIDSATVGGAEENTALMAAELARRGHAVLLLSPQGPFTRRFDALPGVETERVPLRTGLIRARAALGRILEVWRPDLVHSHMLRADVVMALQGRRTPYLRLSHVHNMFDREVPSPLRRAAYRLLAAWAYRRFDGVLPVSEHVRGFLASYLGVSGERVRVVPNGIDATGFRRRAVAGPVPSVAKRVVLTVGRLDENKGQELVIRALARLGRSDLQLWIVGTGPREEALRRELRQRGVDGRLLGRRDDVPALMACAAVVVQASRWEALPNTVLEALALGRPTVATAAGGTGEAVRDGETGWLVPVEDVEALAGALAQALDDPAEASRRGARGRDLVDARFTIGAAAEALLTHPAVADRGPAVA